jgi:hypothetical protein
MSKMEKERCKSERQGKNKMKQQRHRQRVYAAEITSGMRSPGGTKHKQLRSSASLIDMSDMSSSSVTELSRPYRAFKEKQQLKKKHPQGRKKTKEHRPVTYYNWHSPFLWNQIVNATWHPSVGWRMSSTWIVSLLKQQDPVTFAGLPRMTVDSWIDRSGDKPKWSSRALKMASNGNDPGLGNKGGRRGIFMRPYLVDLPACSLTCLPGTFSNC